MYERVLSALILIAMSVPAQSETLTLTCTGKHVWSIPGGNTEEPSSMGVIVDMDRRVVDASDFGGRITIPFETTVYFERDNVDPRGKVVGKADGFIDRISGDLSVYSSVSGRSDMWYLKCQPVKKMV